MSNREQESKLDQTDYKTGIILENDIRELLVIEAYVRYN